MGRFRRAAARWATRWRFCAEVVHMRTRDFWHSPGGMSLKGDERAMAVLKADGEAAAAGSCSPVPGRVRLRLRSSHRTQPVEDVERWPTIGSARD